MKTKTSQPKADSATAEVRHKVTYEQALQQTQNAKSQWKCTKSPVSYVEALAIDRNKLRAQLNRVTAERDQLFKACKAMDIAYQRVPDTHLPLNELVSSGRWNEMGNAITEVRAAIAACEKAREGK